MIWSSSVNKKIILSIILIILFGGVSYLLCNNYITKQELVLAENIKRVNIRKENIRKYDACLVE